LKVRPHHIFTALIGLLCSLCVSWGQQPQPATPVPSEGGAAQEPFHLQVNTRAVVLDVVVTDQKNNIVRNLTKDDFQVFEDKVPQRIRTLDPPGSHVDHAPVAIHSSAELDKLEPEAPVTILVLDEIAATFEDEGFARYSLKKYLGTQGDVLPQPTMFIAVNVQGFMVLSDFTTSKRDILSALDRHHGDYQRYASWKAEQYTAVYASLLEVAEATAGHAGHKSVIWIGRGFPAFDPETLTPSDGEVLKQTLEICTNALKDARVVLYTLDPAGAGHLPDVTNDDEYYDPFSGKIDFNRIAAATGGRAFAGRNDVDELIATSAREAGGFYTLSYAPSAAITEANAFRHIRVVMKDPNLHVETREGYYSAPTAAVEAPATNGKLSTRAVFDLMVAGQSTMIYDAVPLTVERVAANSDQFKISFDSMNATWAESAAGKLDAEITVLTEVFDKKGKLLDRKTETAMAQVPESATANVPATAKVSFIKAIPAQPPAARIRVVVRLNGNHKLGTANVFLVDPSTLSDPSIGLTPKK
jgi:VWFA-related protein